MQVVAITMDFSTVCRACLSDSELHPIFLGSDDQKRYTAAIHITTGLKVEPNDGLPQKMCTSCMTFLNNTLKYRKQCKDNEKQLLKWKTELDTANIPNITFVEIAVPVHDGTKSNSRVEKKHIKTEVEIESLTEHHEIVNIADAFKKTDTTKKIEYGKKRQKRKQRHSAIKTDDTNQEYMKFDISAKELPPDILQDNIFEDDMSLNYFLNDHESVNSTDKDETVVYVKDCNIEESEETEVPVERGTRGSARVSCRLCRRELSARSLRSHYSRAHPTVLINKTKCDLCEKWVMQEKMSRHRKLAHGDCASGDTVKCGYCKCAFSSQTALVEHVVSCTTKGVKRKAAQSGKELRECDVCHKKMQKASLRMHKAVKHAGLGPVCEHCGGRFGNKFRLQEHCRAKHGYEKYRCWRCDFQSAGALAMQNHERRHRGEKPFVCETCGAKFHAAYLLAQHRQSHRADKLLKCDLCPASFKANNSLHMHKASCHSRCQYKCHVCARAYSCRHYAVKHMRHVHGFEGPVPELQRVDGDNKGIGDYI